MVQQGLRLVGPLHGNLLLRLLALLFVQLFLQRLGGAPVAVRQLLEHLVHQLHRRSAAQPLTDTRGTLTRRGSGKRTPGEGIQRMRRRGSGGLGRGGGVHGGGVGWGRRLAQEKQRHQTGDSEKEGGRHRAGIEQARIVAAVRARTGRGTPETRNPDGLSPSGLTAGVMHLPSDLAERV